MRIDILTLFPEMFQGILSSSIIKIAIDKKKLDVRLCNFRNFSYEKHRKVDDRPYGGGAGMLLKPEPIFRAVETIEPVSQSRELILLSPQGERFSQNIAEELKNQDHLVLICGHYEGFDERIRQGLPLREISVGDYVLSGGEIPAMTVLDSIARLLPGVIDSQSLLAESFQNNQLEYPQYTRPAKWRGMEVPTVLCSGNHKKIQEWQQKMSWKKTNKQRPDLL